MNRDVIDGLLGAAVGDNRLPGVAAAAATLEGPIYEGAFGLRDVAAGAPMTLETVLRIASMTKAVTSVAALQLVERGELSLDAPLGGVLPELDDIPVLEGFAGDGTPILRAARQKITLRHLLTHTAGFGYDTWNSDLFRYVAATGHPTLASGLKAGLRLPLAFDPGTRWQYGINIDWVGQAIEAASGMTLGAYFSAHILAPLDMKDTAYRLRSDMRDRLACLYGRDAAGHLVAIDAPSPPAPQFETGGGGMYSTVRDYLRFLRMLLGGGGLDGARILSSEVLALAMRDQIAPLPVTMMASNVPTRSRDAEFFPGTPKGWGLIGMVNRAATPTGRSAGAVAWAGLMNTFWWVDPPRGLAGVLATQVLPFADPVAVGLFEAYEAALG